MGFLGEDLFRIPIFHAIGPILREERDDVPPPVTAEVSGRALVDELGFPTARFTELRRPYFDLMMGRLPTGLYGKFDVVLADQVLEHVLDPRQAVKTLHRLLRPGGLAVVTTVFLFPGHDQPEDYWRFSPRALEVLFAGWKDVHADGFGNRELAELAHRWQVLNRNPEYRWVLKQPNDPVFPVIVWAWARRT